MRRFLRAQKGAALVEYALVLPFLLLLFLGTLEVFRLVLLKQSLSTGLREVLPCYTHSMDGAYLTDVANIRCQSNPLGIDHIRTRLAQSLFSLQSGYDLAITTNPPLETLTSEAYGQLLEVTAVLDVPLAFYALPAWPLRIQITERAMTFIDISPAYIGLRESIPFPHDPGGY